MDTISRREAMAVVGAGLVSLTLARAGGAAEAGEPFTLPKLPYAFDALEPAIDAKTMEIHHDKHHAAYVANLNKAVDSTPELKGKSLEWLLANLAQVPQKVRTAVRNNGGGHANHTLFWESMKAGGGGAPGGALAQAIDGKWKSFDDFKGLLSKAGATQFGSGWAWLVLDDKRELDAYSLANQDSPVSRGHVPLLGLDVWEHAYYLKYQNRRPDYIAAWWSVVNWPAIEARYDAALKLAKG